MRRSPTPRAAAPRPRASRSAPLPAPAAARRGWGHDLAPRIGRQVGLVTALAAATASASWAQSDGGSLPPVEVIGTSPLPGQGVDRSLLPYSTQLIRRSALDEAKSDNLSDYLTRHVPGVQVNDIQGSPFQGDLTYRGFRASPLLGASQGLSVYLDGVRINEPFGDVVNWDMLPEFSVRSVSLVPGANPAFGLNTLGGALSFETESGLTAPGFRAELSAGSFGRKRIDASYGRQYEGGWHSYLAGSWFDEDGWRQHSEGDLGQLLAKFGRSTESTDWSVGLVLGRSKLIGNGLVPAYTIDDGRKAPDLYAFERDAVYTYPDLTRNRTAQLQANLRQVLEAQRTLDALVYVRRSTRSTVNGDEADDDAGGDGEFNAAFNTTETKQTGVGAALAVSGKDGRHQWQAGGSVDASRTHYEQFEQPGVFDDSRGVLPGDEPRELSAEVSGRTLAFGLFATDTIELLPRTHLTVTARYNQARVTNTLTTRDDDTDEIEAKPTERFTYRSLNPAIGLAHRLEAGPTLYANIARNNRVPTVIELGCADPEEPCRLPAGLQADPYLKQVISRTVEAGVRWPVARDLNLTLSGYRTDNRDDILFRSTSVNGQLGYFENFDRTRYQGWEAQAQGRAGALSFAVGYARLDATYQADGVLRQGERNVVVAPGTRIAGLPRHSLKISADFQATPQWSFGGDLQAFSKRGVAGNEDGRIEDGEDTRMNLDLPGYELIHLRTTWRSSPGKDAGWEVYAKVNNLLDTRYETFGALAATQFSPRGVYTGEERDAVSVAPGAPRSFMVGVRLRY